MNIDASLAGKRILIVDDSTLIRRNLRASLADHGFKNIAEAADGLDAKKILQNGSYDLVISDWEMPRMSGVELYQAIKGQNQQQPIPFILLTQHNKKERVLEAIKTGITHYVVKPVAPETFVQKVVEVLQ